MSLDTRISTLPMLVLRGLVCFPETVMHFDVGRLKSVAALNAAMEKDQLILVTILGMRAISTDAVTVRRISGTIYMPL